MDPRTESATESRPPQGPPKRRLRLVLVVFLIAAIAVVGYVLTRPDSSDQAPPNRTTVASFQGTGDDTTETFNVTKSWRIDWKSTGKRFAFAITGDRDFGTVIDRKEPGSGITTAEGTGTFRLVIKAKGSWSARILQDA
jgi:hypothetical protein